MTAEIKALERQLEQCQIADSHRLRRQLHKLRQRCGAEHEQKLQSLAEALRKSLHACQRRDQAIPAHISLPPQLPVSGRAEEIIDLLRQHQVLVIAGDTGSGKTTQLPKLCLQAGLGRRGLIGHTQPRRLAAVSVANRIAEELCTQVGRGVGYQVRFNEKSSPETYLKVMTDGILLAEIAQDRFLNRYDTIIVDEAHERSLNIDFLLGFLKQLLQRRRDLKLIITSATIDLEKFSSHFGGAPIVSVSGRTYPVELRYAPVPDDVNDGGEGLTTAVVEQVRGLLAEKSGAGGDILVFLSGEREIRETAQALRKQRLAGLDILPLYARLRQAEQTKVFQPHKGRRVVLATNVAETSITVPGINYVIDTGLARISRYSPQSKVQRLPIEPVSQASANQRKGRCGRLADGICVRLYSEADFDARPEFTDPELRRTNLAAVILRMRHLRLGDPEQFPFLEAPDGSAIREGIKLLMELNALDQKQRLTAAGRKMAVMPVDPRLARMLVVAAEENCLAELLIIVSCLSIQDPRELSVGNRQQAKEQLERYEHPDSDFLSLVKLWEDYEQKRQNLSQGQLRKFCRQNFLSYMRMREWREVHRQLLLSCQQLGFVINRKPASYESVHRAIISGSLNQIANLQEGKTYLGNRNRKFFLSSNSVLAGKTTKWIVTGELIETTQTFAAMAARIQPQWVEQMALHLLKRDYFEPHWSSRQQEVQAYEKVSLYGLNLVEKRPVFYGPLQADLAREIFIRDGLAAGEVKTGQSFYRQNQKLLTDLAREEEKIRRPEFFVAESDVVRFYDERVPADISSTRELEHWLRGQRKRSQGKAVRKEPEALVMTRESLLRKTDQSDATEQFPDQASVNHNRLHIDYVFDPGSDRDGATVTVPMALLPQLQPADIDWAVPGLIRDKCINLLKSLPKATRKNFIPVSGFVDQVLPAMSVADGDVLDALLRQIRAHKKLQLERGDFANEQLPRHLCCKIRVVDEDGNEQGFGNELGQLQDELGIASQGQGKEQTLGHPLERSGMHDWEIDALPQELKLGDELVLIRYPALTAEDNSVAVRLYGSRGEAEVANRRGLLQLFKLRSVQQKNRLRKQFTRLRDRLALVLPLSLGDLVEQGVNRCYMEAFAIAEQRPASRDQFEALLNQGRSRLESTATKLSSLLEAVLQQRWELLQRLRKLDSADLDYVRQDVETQLQALFGPGCIEQTALRWLQQYPRYLNAIALRLDKLPHLGPRDRPNTEAMARLQREFEDWQQRLSVSTPELETLRWMLQEYRVSLFAQNLGTEMPVSEKRLSRQFAALQQSASA